MEYDLIDMSVGFSWLKMILMVIRIGEDYADEVKIDDDLGGHKNDYHVENYHNDTAAFDDDNGIDDDANNVDHDDEDEEDDDDIYIMMKCMFVTFLLILLSPLPS